MAIKDYLAVDLDDMSIQGDKNKIRKSPVFSIIESNETDIIIRKETPKTCKELVLIMSKQLFYVRNVKTNENIKITSSKDISLFLSGCNLLIDGPTWFNVHSSLYSDMFAFIKTYGSNEDFVKVYSSLCHKEKYIEVLFENKEILISLMFIIKKITTFNCGLKGLILTLKFIENDRLIYTNKVIKIIDLFKAISFMNYNSLKEFLYKFQDAYGELYSEEKDYRCDYINSLYGYNMANIIKNFNLDLSTFISYITYELSSQGYTFVSPLREYRDVLDLQLSIYGKVKDKYPKNLLTVHNILVKKNNLLSKYKTSIILTELYNNNKHLEYTDSSYSVIIPDKTSDLIDEGMSLSHCVAIYIDKVINKECYICFIRDTSIINESLLTVEIVDNTIVQVKGKCNRPPNDKEIAFISKWAKNKKLDVKF